jgi:uncharacterized protein (TIGR03435 family)
MNNILPILVAVLNSLWQAAIVAALVWLVLRLAPRMNLAINAGTRYVIWWAVLGIVLILPLASAAGFSLRRASARPPTPAEKPTATQPILPAAADAPVLITLHEERSARWPIWVFGIWSAVFLYRLAEIARSYFYLSGVKRRATASSRSLPENKRPASLLLSPEVASPMAVGFLRPAVILPASLESEITEEELRYVLLHEYAHLERRDDWWNLVAHLLGAALALHPAAWWILRQIGREREMACDDWVVARTGAARPYAASLARLSELRFARRKQLQGEALAAGIFGGGSRLGERIELLLRRKPPVRWAAGLAGCLLAVATLAAVFTPRWIAFAQQLAFDVASVKPADPNLQSHLLGSRNGSSFTATDATLKQLVGFAYDVGGYHISGGPKWLDSDRYSVEGKPDSATPISRGPAGIPAMRAMLQQLLAERFKLAVHHETREEQVYELVVTRGGSKLKDADTTRAGPKGIGSTGPGRLQGMAASMDVLVQVLAPALSRSIIDKTGLTGKYDFTLEYTPELAQLQLSPPGPPDGQGPPPPDPNGPSLFTALQEQLGLRLESAKGPVEILVIDHAEKPDAN